MITLRRIMIRPHLEVEFFPETPEYISTLEEFKSAGKITNESLSLSDDQLTQIRELVFPDDEQHMFWRHNPNIVSWIKHRKKHDSENAIITDIDFV